MKKWTRDKVINTLQDCDGYEKFLNESGILSICVDNVDLLFFYAYDRVEIYYKKYIDKDVDLSTVREFCDYAQPYLEKKVSKCRYEKLVKL